MMAGSGDAKDPCGNTNADLPGKMRKSIRPLRGCKQNQGDLCKDFNSMALLLR